MMLQVEHLTAGREDLMTVSYAICCRPQHATAFSPKQAPYSKGILFATVQRRETVAWFE